MSVDAPKKYDREYLVSHFGDETWPSFVIDHYVEILDDFDPAEVPFASACLSYALLNAMPKMDHNEAFEWNMCTIDIIRYGINFATDAIVKPSDIGSKHDLISIRAELLRYLSVSMVNCGRYTAALHYLDDAGKQFENFYSLYDDGPDAFVDFKVSYEMTRAEEAQIYLKMVPFVSDDHKRLMATFAHSYLDHAVSNMMVLGSDDYKSYCNSY